ncbi:hypothetical protein DVP60_11915 [Yersinia enterocolitica]|nr:hypothetical protein [Yersinia enterocolitica]
MENKKNTILIDGNKLTLDEGASADCILNKLTNNELIDRAENINGSDLYQFLDFLDKKSLLDIMLGRENPTLSDLPSNYKTAISFDGNYPDGVKLNCDIVYSKRGYNLLILDCEVVFSKSLELLSYDLKVIDELPEELSNMLDARTITQRVLDWLSNLFHGSAAYPDFSTCAINEFKKLSELDKVNKELQTTKSYLAEANAKVKEVKDKLKRTERDLADAYAHAHKVEQELNKLEETSSRELIDEINKIIEFRPQPESKFESIDWDDSDLTYQ